MPSYLTDQLGFDLSSAGLLSVLPYVALFVFVMASGNLFHWLQEEKSWSTTQVRRTAQFVGYTGAGLGLVFCSFVSNAGVAFMFVVLAQGLLGVSNSGFLCSFLDIAPHYSALLASISNTVGATAGIMGPIAVGYLTTAYPGILGWQLVFYISAAQCAVAIVLWHYFQHSAIIPELNTPQHKVKWTK
jgi:MFS transporter, ACS family, solute carrier family 17 (sodium-dependent inorganic phosphate cotransporter), other